MEIENTTSSSSSSSSRANVRDKTPNTPYKGHHSLKKKGNGTGGMDVEGGEIGEEETPVLYARLENVKVVSTLLNAISFKKDQIGICCVSSTGIQFTCEDESKSMQAHAFLKSLAFAEFRFSEKGGGGTQTQTQTQTSSTSSYDDGEHTFGISIPVLVSCLNIFGSVTPFVSATMTYKGYGNPLVVILEENDATTECEIQTLDCNDPTSYDFLSSPIGTKMIMPSEWLKEAFNELDWSSDVVTILTSPMKPFFRLKTNSSTGSCQVDYPNPENEKEMFEHFECEEEREFDYKLSLMQPAIKALALSSKTSVRVNKTGMLSLQHMIQVDDSPACFTDFYVVAQQ